MYLKFSVFGRIQIDIFDTYFCGRGGFFIPSVNAVTAVFAVRTAAKEFLNSSRACLAKSLTCSSASFDLRSVINNKVQITASV